MTGFPDKKKKLFILSGKLRIHFCGRAEFIVRFGDINVQRILSAAYTLKL